MKSPDGFRRAWVGWSVTAVVSALAMAGSAGAAPSQRVRKARGCVMTQDQSALEQFVSFLRAYHQALGAGDRTFLGAHTQFPLPFASATYDMEAKAQRRVLGAVDGLLTHKESLQWPAVLLPKTAAELSQIRRGQQKCGDAESPDVPDFQKGEPAFSVSGCEVSFTYLASACESETHLVTLRFVRDARGWLLVERSVRMGAQ